MTFLLKIACDYPPLVHPRNIARALERTARELDEKFGLMDAPAPAHGTVSDLAGVIVGTWELTTDDQATAPRAPEPPTVRCAGCRSPIGMWAWCETCARKPWGNENRW